MVTVARAFNILVFFFGSIGWERWVMSEEIIKKFVKEWIFFWINVQNRDWCGCFVKIDV